MLKGIVFDLDGTLVDSLSVTFDAFNHAITQFGGRKHSPQEILAYFGPGESTILSKILGADKAEVAYQACRTYTDERLHKVPLFAGIPELLEQLKSTGVPISIFTGRGWDTTEMILKHHRILDRFVTVISNDHVDWPKPSPEGLQKAAQAMKLPASDLLFVGDSPVDIKAAHAGGAQGVAALWDLLASREHLTPTRPHHWAETPAELWGLWQSLRSGEPQ